MIAALPVTSLQIYTDGSAIPNPGYAGSGVFAIRNKVPIFSLAEGIGTMETNNTGEYFAIGLGLHKAESIMQELDFPVTRIDVLSDSRIAINGIEGIWTIRSRLHRRLAYQAQIPLKKLRQDAEVFSTGSPHTWILLATKTQTLTPKLEGKDRGKEFLTICRHLPGIQLINAPPPPPPPLLL